MNITTGPNGEFARHHLMVILAPILLDQEIVNAHVTGEILYLRYTGSYNRSFDFSN